MNGSPNPKQIARLRKACDQRSGNHARNNGVRRTRIPVDMVADMLAKGATAEGILEGYPTLNEEMISLAPLYARVLRPQRYAPPPYATQGLRRRASALFRLGQ